MRSSELAELAGVTVRTLRHYHQIGLLPEPSRSAGGYRQYDVAHLVRLLRITRMTALGVPLSELPTALDDPAGAEELLAELDCRTAAEMERLAARRAAIAALRRAGAPPDLPPELSTWRSASVEKMTADMARYEHELLVLLAHLLGPDGPRQFAALLGRGDEHVTAVAPLTTRLYALEPDTPADEIAALIDEMVAQLAPVATRLSLLVSDRGDTLIDQFAELSLTPVQYRALREVERRLASAAGDAM